MLSRYSMVVPVEDKQEFIIYNTLFRAAVSVNAELYDLLNNGRQVGGGLWEKYREEIKTLKEMGIVRREDTDERDYLKKWYRAYQCDTSHINLNILTTYQCNLDCEYCYEEGRKKSAHMDGETADAVVEWLEARATQIGAREIRMAFFGGEPLLQTAPVERIAKEIRRWAQDEQILVKVGVITNGVLLNREMARWLSQCGVDFVKITLDGIGDSHDKKRHTKSGRGTFDIIIKNLLAIGGVIKINITGNFDSENYNSALKLPVYLEEIGLKPYIQRLRFKPLKDTFKIATASAQRCQVGGYTVEEVCQMMELRKVLVENGYEVEEDFALGPCEFHHQHSFTIDVKGDIYPCGGFPGIPQFIMGNVKEKSSHFVSKEERDIPSQCGECAFFASCGGGCRYLSYLKTANTEDVTCELTYFGKAAPAIVEETLKSQLASVE